MHNLMHHLNQANLRRAFHSLDGSKASGIDHVTKSDYQQHLDHHLQALEQSLRGGGWRPQPAREVLIPKPQGGMRPLAIGCLEDKIVQTVVARILEAVYEPTFHRHSYGFRPGKSAHQALGRAYETIRDRQRSCVVVESPILANICLHALLDTWFVKHWADKGEFVRYADDAIFVFTDEADARSFQQALGAHLAEAGLKLNLDKTRIVPFSASAPKGTITLLGFEFYWGQHLGKGKGLRVKTIPKRLARAAQNFREWIKATRNRKTLASIWDMAAHKLVGHYHYYGVISNEAKLSHFYWSCVGSLYRWLNRRSQKRSYTWEQFLRRLRYSPLPRPPRGPELIDISSEHDAVRKHKPKSRMPKLGTYGSVRSASLKLVFT